ncbi:hypothetical protein MCUN1_001609 [Malassezia cuniculi]|uniref:Uncharacterized protein n=1 Tax=Malassezia cuniculi TaxID=948313 RepID=A0AAF0EQY7_9BASI|nr:hypothetical protein MCUN1_001609 [Malassezia cuniculi]
MNAESNASAASSQPARAPGLARRGPRLPLGTESYDAIDFDQISDPFTDTRRAFMRGDTATPPAPRNVPHAPPAARKRSMSPEAPLQKSSPRRVLPMSPRKSPFQKRRATISPERPPKSPKKSPKKSPERGSPVRDSPVRDTRTSPQRAAPTKVLTQRSLLPAAEPVAPRKSAAKLAPPVPTTPPPASASSQSSSPDVVPAKSHVNSPFSNIPDEAFLWGPPQRSNRLLTQELLSWKQKYAALSDQMAALQSSADSAEQHDTAAWSADIAALEKQVIELEKGRERDRRAMRQRVRVLETHMADAKIEYDSRYWKLLTSSPGTDEAAVELVSTRNEVTRLQGTVADLRRRLRETQEQAAFLVGLYKWRAQSGSENAQRMAEVEREELLRRNAELEEQLQAETRARKEAERRCQDAESALADAEELVDGPASHVSIMQQQQQQLQPQQLQQKPSAPLSPDTHTLSQSSESGSQSDTEDVAPPPPPQTIAEPLHARPRVSNPTPGARPRGRPRKRPVAPADSLGLEHFGIAPRASTSSVISEPAPLPGATPMVARTALGEGTPMIDAGSPTRKKKRKLLGKSGGIFRLAEGTSGLAQGLDLPTELSPVKPGTRLGMTIIPHLPWGNKKQEAHDGQQEQRRGRQMVATGRGGAGNMYRSTNQLEMRTHGTAEDERRAHEALHNVHCGRGGVGNFRSPSREPADRIRRENEEIEAQAREDYLQQQEFQSQVQASGRGGVGNIAHGHHHPHHHHSNSNSTNGEERGRSPSLPRVGNMIRSLSRSRSREPRAARPESATSRGSGLDLVSEKAEDMN